MRATPSALFSFAFLLLPFTFPAALALLFYVALLSRHRKSSSRPLRLVGRVGSVERDLEPEGFGLVGGELWLARVRVAATAARVSEHVGETVAREGERVRVVGARGCVLEVERLG